MAAPAEVLVEIASTVEDTKLCSTDDTCNQEYKRRKLDDTTTTTPIQKHIEADSEDSDEDSSDSEEYLEAFSQVNSHLTERLCALQSLLPHGLELEEDEILAVAIEYVKELEKQIQMFDSSATAASSCGHGLDDAPLQKRGLCIVPLSTLAKAL